MVILVRSLAEDFIRTSLNSETRKEKLMAHAGKRTLRHRPPTEVKKEVRRRQTKVRFLTVTDNEIQDSPAFFETEEFRCYSKHASIVQFIRDFWKWNEKVLWLVNSTSQPYIELQTELAKMIGPRIADAGTLVDLGCGAGDFCIRLMAEGFGGKLKKIFAIDIDWKPLADIPENLRVAGYRRSVALIQAATMSTLPVWDETADCVVSSLGGVMYAGSWFDEDGKLVYEGREALDSCLKDVNRILKPGGYLALSVPKPNPDWGAVLRSSILHSVMHGHLFKLIRALKYGSQARAASAFMNQLDKDGRAHYLSSQDWAIALHEAGFEIVDSSFGQYYAKQGGLIVAQKK
jgi:SAM-dependent methyltransferase